MLQIRGQAAPSAPAGTACLSREPREGRSRAPLGKKTRTFLGYELFHPWGELENSGLKASASLRRLKCWTAMPCPGEVIGGLLIGAGGLCLPPALAPAWQGAPSLPRLAPQPDAITGAGSVDFHLSRSAAAGKSLPRAT